MSASSISPQVERLPTCYGRFIVAVGCLVGLSTGMAARHLPAEENAEKESRPKRATGVVVDEQGEGIAGVRIRLRRSAKADLDDEWEDEFGISSWGVGEAKTDAEGRFEIVIEWDAPFGKSFTEGPVHISTEHADYQAFNQIMEQAEGMKIELVPEPVIAQIREILEEKDPKRVMKRTIILLKWTSETANDSVHQVYRYLGDLREPLRKIATDESWDTPVDRLGMSVGSRARKWLAYWGDPRDEDLLHRWWSETEEKRQKMLGSGALEPEIEADSLEEAIEAWKKAFDSEGGTLGSPPRLPNRAIYRYVRGNRLHQKYTDVVLVRREDKWRVLFYVPSGSIFISPQL